MTPPSSLEHQINTLSTKLTESIAHQERESKFAVEANDRFEKNIRCFEKYYKDIANAIKEFQTRDDFCLHVTTTGYGNFVPNGLEAPIYSDDPIQQTKDQIEAQTRNPVYSLTDYTGYPQDETDTRIHSRYMTKLTRYMSNVQNDNECKIKELPTQFPTALIFGVGLGYHVPLLLERADFEYIFLVEPDFEQFFASLFCCDWFEIIEQVDQQGGCLFFHLGADHKTFIGDIEKIAEEVGAFSIVRSFCYQHTPGEALNIMIKQWCEEYFRFQFGHGFYNDAVTGFAHSLHHIKNNIPTLIKGPNVLDTSTPIFIIGNGPSLDEADEFLKENCDKAIIVSAGTSIASLVKKGIQSDFHVLVERPLYNHNIFGRILPREEYKKTNLLALNMVHPDTNLRYKWSGIAVKGSEAGTSMMDLVNLHCHGSTLPKIPYCNPVVANCALSYFLFMGYRNIYLFGVDNGSSQDGAHHSKDSIYKKMNDDESQGFIPQVIEGSELPGNFGGTVVSNDILKVAHIQLEKLIGYYDVDSVMNVGSGAYISKTTPVKPCDLIDLVTPLNKEHKVETIKSDFFSELNVTENELTQFIAVDRLQSVVEHILSIANEEKQSRHELLINLRRQQRYLYSLKGTVLEHVFHLVKGAMLYYHCPLITLLYSYSNEEYTMNKVEGLNELWCQYLSEIKLDFAENYMSTCSWNNGE